MLLLIVTPPPAFKAKLAVVAKLAEIAVFANDDDTDLDDDIAKLAEIAVNENDEEIALDDETAQEDVPFKDPVNDPVYEDAVTLDRIATDPDVIIFFQLGIF
jgi:hypothetical protein